VSLRGDWSAKHGDDDVSDCYLLTHLWQETPEGWRLRWRSQAGYSLIREELDAASASARGAAMSSAS
jgi:hypothetical protein